MKNRLKMAMAAAEMLYSAQKEIQIKKQRQREINSRQEVRVHECQRKEVWTGKWVTSGTCSSVCKPEGWTKIIFNSYVTDN